MTRKLDRCGVDIARGGSTGRVQRRQAVTEAGDGDGPFVHTVGAYERHDRATASA
jgi:hypothetical protein